MNEMINKSDARPARLRLPWGMLPLLFAVEFFVLCNALDFRNLWAWDWWQTGRAASRVAPKAEILCFGDSQVKFGVAARVLEARLGLRAYNLALNAGPPQASYYLLRRALESGARPKAMLIDFIPHALASDSYKGSYGLWADIIDNRQCFDLAWSYRDASFFAATMLARALPSFKDRFEIRADVMAALRGQSASQRPELPGFLRQWEVNHGSQIMPKNRNFRGNTEIFRNELYPDDWRSSPQNALYVRRILEVAAEHRIPVFWLLMPFSSEVEALRERKGLDVRYDRFVNRCQARYPNFVVIDGRRSGYDHAVHVDPIHLDREGALALSVDVAEILRRYLTDPTKLPRWVTLPAYRTPVAEVPLEDANESQLAIRQVPDTVRR
jgi:hypothetical protein